jgi:hypothetical protein
MSLESHLVHMPIELNKEILVPACVAPSPPNSLPSYDAETAKAVEAVFAAQERESNTVIGLLGLWTGTALLNDLAIETFSETEGEVEPEEKRPSRDE